MVHLTDSLAVYNLFSQVDSNLSIEEVTAILQASSSETSCSLESAITALGKILVSGFNPRIGSVYNTDRDFLYKDINAITAKISGMSGLTIKAMAQTDSEGNITPFSPSKINNLAKIDIAYRYALVNLNSFAVLGADYSNFNQNGELDIYDLETGEGLLSDMYLTDRAAMLSYLIQNNIHDGYNESTVRFEDKASGEVIVQPGLFVPQYSVVFGSALNDKLTGTTGTDGRSNFNDHLYGGGGDDTLYGKGGDDYLEGGEGRSGPALWTTSV